MKGQSLMVRIKATVTYAIPFFLGLLVFVLCFGLDWYGLADVAEFFQKNMRASLFAGFLTLGSFLLSLKTGIVIKIKENLYDKDTYQKKVHDALAAGVRTSVYAPLRRLSKLLSAAVLFALIASVLQLTVGLFSYWWAAAICLSMATVALTYLLIAFVLIQINLTKWFEHLEDDAEEARQKKLEAAKAAKDSV